jgi:hypothetical protein
MKIEQILQQNLRDVKNNVVLYKGEAYHYWDSGLTRHVFVNADKTKVIKFLIEKNHTDYNLEEFQQWEKASPEVRMELAETSLELNGLVIEQEFCNPIKWDDRKMNMKQILFAGRCRHEVGWDKDGNLKCFDLSEYKQY